MSVEDLLDEATDLFTLADDHDAPWPQRCPAFEAGADLLMSATTMTDDVEHLDRVLSVGDGIVGHSLLQGVGLAPPSAGLISAYLRLADANLEHFEFGSRATDLRTAESCLRTAAELHEQGRYDSPIVRRRCAVGRARLAAYRTETFGDDDDLAVATDELRVWAEDCSVAGGWLARCLRIAAPTARDPVATLHEAIELVNRILRTPMEETAVLPWLDAAWGAERTRCLLDVYAYTGSSADRVLAVSWAWAAYRRQQASVPALCALARAERSAITTASPERADQIRQMHVVRDLVVHGRNWHNWLLAREYAAWCRDTGESGGTAAARFALDIALDAAERESGPEERRTWLREAAALAPLTTDRLLADHDPAAMAFRLERGRGLTLHERFADEFVELRDVEAAGHLGLAADLRDALSATRSTQVGARGRDVAARRLQWLTAQARELPGLERFRARLEVEGVVEAAGPALLVYLLPGPTHGWAIGYDPEEGWFDERLPLCRTEPTPLPVIRFRSTVRAAGMPAGARRQAVTGVCAWLWDAVYAPLRGRLRGRVCHVVAHGYLGELPLHAARADIGTPSAVHESDIRYVPSARHLLHSRQVLQDADPDDQVFLGVPPPDGSGLAAAEEEMALVSSWFSRAVVLRADERTREDVVSAVRSAGWLHASCHGLADPADPMRSGLLLAGDDRLTLGDLARATTGHLTLAVLSACQTAVADPDLPDEELSLGAGFLSTGCGAVIASSWPVPDQATGALMTLFYRGWRGAEALTPAEALRGAQRVFADGSAGPWREPYFWAGFRYLGW